MSGLQPPLTSRTTKQFQIVSPPFACGVAWLVNALLALDIKVTHAGFGSAHWNEDDNGCAVTNKAAEHLKWHLPIFHTRDRFVFPEDIEIRWEHRLDFADATPRPTLLFVRDPRDAIFSLYRRNYATSVEFAPYLNRPDEWPHHFPGLFQLPPFETYAYFSWYWLRMNKIMPVRIVRFEDVKQDSARALNEVLQFLGVERSEDAIANAIASSGFESARQAMESMEQATGKAFKTVRKAQPREWVSTYSPEALEGISEIGKACIQSLGYEGNAHTEAWLDTCDELYCRQRLSEAPSASEKASLEWLEKTCKGMAPSVAEISCHILDQDICGEPLLLLASIAEAIFYTRNIFSDTSQPSAQLALFTFAGLNLKFFDEWQIQYAAWLCLQRMENETQAPICRKVGKEKIFAVKAKEHLWMQ